MPAAPRESLTGNALKWIAIFTMLIDHVGATVIESVYLTQRTRTWWWIYVIVRGIGRIAFPIFCFLLVEGFCHTRSRGRYALRLGLFSLVAEIPFDLAFNDPRRCDPNWLGLLEFDSQNVFFTLFLGLLCLWLWESVARRLPRWAEIPAGLLAAVPGYFAAELLCTDYGGFGVVLIMVLGMGRGLPRRAAPSQDGSDPLLQEPGRERRMLQCVLAIAVLWLYCWLEGNLIEPLAAIGLQLTLRYNGRRGKGGKWFFYLFYPVHLLVLGIALRLFF